MRYETPHKIVRATAMLTAVSSECGLRFPVSSIVFFSTVCLCRTVCVLELLGVARLMMSLMLSGRVYCLWIPEKDKRSDASPIVLEIRKFKVIFFLFKNVNLTECNYSGVRSDKFSLDLGNSIRFYTFSLSSYSWARYSLETVHPSNVRTFFTCTFNPSQDLGKFSRSAIFRSSVDYRSSLCS